MDGRDHSEAARRGRQRVVFEAEMQVFRLMRSFMNVYDDETLRQSAWTRRYIMRVILGAMVELDEAYYAELGASYLADDGETP